MRNQWRLFLRRHHHSLSSPSISRSFSLYQVNSSPSLNFLSSISFTPFTQPLSFPFESAVSRYFSSEPALDQNDPELLLLVDLFSKSVAYDEIRQELESKNVVISHDLVLRVLRSLELNPGTARKFFDWVLERESKRLSSKTYNLMLRILGVNGFVKEFWDMVDAMKHKGYGVSKGTFLKVSEKFGRESLDDDLEKLRGLFLASNEDNSVESLCSRVSKIIRQGVWDEDVEKQLKELNFSYSSELVTMVVDRFSTEPSKALIFFRWVDENGLFKHDERTYNAIALALGREDCIDRFWNVVGEIRDAGFEMEMGTYIKVLDRFIKRRMMKDAVDLYEFAMNGANKPSVQDCTFLLRKIVVAKELDLELFSRVVKVFKENGNDLTDSTLNAVLKSLRSVGRIGECDKVLEALMEGGLRPSSTLQSKIALGLSRSKKENEANEFVKKLEAYGLHPDEKTWASLVEGYCIAGDLNRALECLKKLVEREDGASSTGHAVEFLVNAYCNKNRAGEACRILSDLVSRRDVRPWHTTYKKLISKLVVQGGFKDALGLLDMMKNHGFPPFLDPLIWYVSKRGTADHALSLLKAMTVNKFPSTTVFLRLFEALFKAGRCNEAQDLLAKCPQYIRNHVDVLNLFYSMKNGKPGQSVAVAA